MVSSPRRLASLKLLENDYPASKRLRIKDPSMLNLFESVGGGGGTEVGMNSGSDRIPALSRGSFNLTGVWSGISTDFGFAPGDESIDGEEDTVHNVNDAMLEDLSFLKLGESATVSESDGNIDENNPQQQKQRLSPSDGGIQQEGGDSSGIGEQKGGGRSEQAESASANNGTTASEKISTARRTYLAADARGSMKNLPLFSMSTESITKRQLEAEEQSIDETSSDDLHRTGSNASGAAAGGRAENSIDSPALDENHATGLSGKINHKMGELYYSNSLNDMFLLGLSQTESGFALRNGTIEENAFAEQQLIMHEKIEPDSGGDDGEDGFDDAEEDSQEALQPKVNDAARMDRSGGGRGRGARAGRRGGRGGRTKSRKPKPEPSERDRREGNATRATAGCAFSGKRQTSEDVAARLPLDMLECFYHVPLNVAAQELHVSLTMLKKLCRAYGVKRWPHRQVSSLDKTIVRLEEKIASRSDGGKDAPSLSRKLEQATKRRSVVIKTASAGLEVDVLNTIFTCRPGDIDEDLLLESNDVAGVVESIQARNNMQEPDWKPDPAGDGDQLGVQQAGSSLQPTARSRPAFKKSVRRIKIAKTPSLPLAPPCSSSARLPVVKQLTSATSPPAFDPGCPAKTFIKSEAFVQSSTSQAQNKRIMEAPKDSKAVDTSSSTGEGKASDMAAAAAGAAGAASAVGAPQPGRPVGYHGLPAEGEGGKVIPESPVTISSAPTGGCTNMLGIESQHPPIIDAGGGSTNFAATNEGDNVGFQSKPIVEPARETSTVPTHGNGYCTGVWGKVGARTDAKAAATTASGERLMPPAPLPTSPLHGSASIAAPQQPPAITATPATPFVGSPPLLLCVPPTPAVILPPRRSRHTYLQQTFPAHQHQHQHHLQDQLYAPPPPSPLLPPRLLSRHQHQQPMLSLSMEPLSPANDNYVATAAVVGQAHGDFTEGFPKNADPNQQQQQQEHDHHQHDQHARNFSGTNPLSTTNQSSTGGDNLATQANTGRRGGDAKMWQPATAGAGAVTASTPSRTTVTEGGGGTRRTGVMRFLLQQPSTNTSLLSDSLKEEYW